MACWARDVRAGCMPVSEGAVAVGLSKRALKAKRKRLGSRVEGVGGCPVGGGSQIDSNKHLVTSHPHWRVVRNRQKALSCTKLPYMYARNLNDMSFRFPSRQLKRVTCHRQLAHGSLSPQGPGQGWALTRRPRA